MKNLFTLIIMAAVLSITACRKTNQLNKPPEPPPVDTVVTEPPPPPPPPKPVYLTRIQEGIDPDLSKDTVYHLVWKDSLRISMLVDSIKNDTLVAAYNEAGYLTAVTDKGAAPDNAVFTYDANNLLTQITYSNSATTQQYVFEYTDGIVSKKSYYTATGNAALKLSSYFTYAFTDGNITTIKAYTSSGINIATASLTYGTQANPFINLCLFNYRKRLNMDDICPFEAYFNKNIVTSLTTFGMTATLNNTFDDKQRIGQIVADDKINQKLFTYLFNYSSAP